MPGGKHERGQRSICWFTERDHLHSAPDSDYPAVDLSRAQVLVEPGPRRIARVTTLAERYGEWRTRVSVKLDEWDIAPDLAQGIGSRRWLRGAATLLSLSAVALSAWPGFSPVEAAPAMRIDDRVRDEFRSQMIMPLALGADSGRRMGATQAVRELARAPERPSLDLTATLTQGDGFARMLQRAGVSADEAGSIAALVAGAMPLSEIKPGTPIDITLGRRTSPDAPRPVDALSFRARFDLQLAVERQTRGWCSIRARSRSTRLRYAYAGPWARGCTAPPGPPAPPPSAVQQYLRALGSELNLDRDVTATDEFDLIVGYKRAATGETEVGEVQYAALIRDGRPRKQLMRWGSEGRFFDTQGVGEVREGLVAPVSGSVSSRYGMRRHPILGYRRMHAGMDFRARSGTRFMPPPTGGSILPDGTAGTEITCACATRATSAPATRI